jgi:diacylglycerol O-acyltransferase
MSSRQRMSLLDATFLRIETAESPMHVASLEIFRIPDGAGPGFVRDIVEAFRAPHPLSTPFGLGLANGPLSGITPTLVPSIDVDLEYHVRHSALPAPGGERELGELISHLHGVALDRSRPLWTCHVIEGLEDNRFAIYVKIHHALTDGVGGMRLMTQSLAGEPDGSWSAPWHHVAERRATERKRTPASTPVSLVKAALPVARGLAGLVRRTGEPVVRPFEAPATPLNGPITAARRVATQQLDLARIKAVADETGTSINDVFLAVCGAGLRRHLSDNELLPERPLTAGVPVSLREPGETGANAVGCVWTSLATDVADPRAQLDAIHRSMQASKEHLQAMPPAARKLFTLATMAPVVGSLLTGIGTRRYPPMNVAISNVPGPKQAVYLNGARLEAFYPVSIPAQGQTLNITCVSYDGKLNIGFTGCRDSLPHLQRIAVYAGDALDDLAVAHPKPRRRRPVDTAKARVLTAVS